nr:iron ABC transporter permease [Clostridioides sp.]
MENIQSASFKTSQHKKNIFYTLLFFLVIILLISIVISVSKGSLNIDPSTSYDILKNKLFGLGNANDVINDANYNIIWMIRFPRVILALIVGAGLALCGTIMQATVQNPLAEPYILGISSGASLGATFSIMLGIGSFNLLTINGTSFWAFIGALFSATMVLLLSSLGGKISSAKLVLSGTVVNALCNALSNFIISMASNADGMQSVKFWTMGSLAGAKWGNILFPTVIVVASCLFFLLQSRNLNLLLMGDESAITLGINLVFYRRLYMIITSLLTGVLVSVCGIIGFVGLIIPHITRSLVGSDHKKLTPISILLGSIFMIWADVLARTIIPNSELSIGIITALVGSPFFVYILLKRSYGFGEK